jgi:quercetin dioxygenase-like cupin family protein
MSTNRIFKSAVFMQPSEGEPIRSVITQSDEATVVGWHIKPGQRIAAHVHPHGQDTWTILSGSGEYQLEVNGTSQSITAGDVVVAHTGEVHGVFNSGAVPLVFISVVAPLEAGFEPL